MRQDDGMVNLGQGSEDGHSIQNQADDVLIPDSVEDRSRAPGRTNAAVSQDSALNISGEGLPAKPREQASSKERITDLASIANEAGRMMPTAPSVNKTLHTQEDANLLIYQSMDIDTKRKGPRISDFKHSLITGTSSAVTGELPYLNQKHLFKNVNAQAQHYGSLIDQQKRKVMHSAALLSPLKSTKNSAHYGTSKGPNANLYQSQHLLPSQLMPGGYSAEGSPGMPRNGSHSAL